MSIQYHLYGNNGAGGPIDWTTIIATTSSLSYTPAALALSSDTSFGVRAYNAALSLEESGVTATVRIPLDGSGNDLSVLPNAPTALTVQQTPAGLTATWLYQPVGQGSRPTGFKVWLTAAGSVDYTASPAVTVSYGNSGPNATYSAVIPGTLTNGTTYAVGARAYNGSGTELNNTQITFVAITVAPANVEALTGVATSTYPR